MSSASVSPQIPPPGEFYLWHTDETGALLIQLNKKDVGLTDGRIALGGRVFEPKPEVHITVFRTRVTGEISHADLKPIPSE